MSSSKTKAVPQTLLSYDHKDLEETKQTKHSDSVYQPLFLLPVVVCHTAYYGIDPIPSKYGPVSPIPIPIPILFNKSGGCLIELLNRN